MRRTLRAVAPGLFLAAAIAEGPSASTCEDLGWFNAAQFGDEMVCSASKIDGACSGLLTQPAAAAFCASTGARLCTLEELYADEARGTGCGYDSELLWTATPCPTDPDHLTFVAPGMSTSTLASECFIADDTAAVRWWATAPPAVPLSPRDASHMRCAAPCRRSLLKLRRRRPSADAPAVSAPVAGAPRERRSERAAQPRPLAGASSPPDPAPQRPPGAGTHADA